MCRNANLFLFPFVSCVQYQLRRPGSGELTELSVEYVEKDLDENYPGWRTRRPIQLPAMLRNPHPESKITTPVKAR